MFTESWFDKLPKLPSYYLFIYLFIDTAQQVNPFREQDKYTNLALHSSMVQVQNRQRNTYREKNTKNIQYKTLMEFKFGTRKFN